MFTLEELVKYSKGIKKKCNCSSYQCYGEDKLYFRPEETAPPRIRYYCDYHRDCGYVGGEFVPLPPKEAFTLKIVLDRT